MALIPATHDPGGPQSGSLADALYTGPLVNVPREGERAFLKGTWNRTSRSPFMISLNKYLEAQRYRLSAGMKFKMRFEGEEFLKKGQPELHFLTAG